MNAKWELLKNSKSNDDSTKEGLLLQMNGGFKKTESKKPRPQKAIIEFLCDKSRTGLENLPTPKDPYEEGKEKREEGNKEGDDKEGEEDGNKEGEDDESPSLEFVRYETEGKDADILRLRWRTKHACEDAIPPVDRWGFFTWFLIMYVFYLFPSPNYGPAY